MSPANYPKTYTGRTLARMGAYALRRKSLVRMVGLRGVEPLTSRLSGPPERKQKTDTTRHDAPASASRVIRDESENPLSNTRFRTQDVHRKAVPPRHWHRRRTTGAL